MEIQKEFYLTNKCIRGKIIKDVVFLTGWVFLVLWMSYNSFTDILIYFLGAYIVSIYGAIISFVNVVYWTMQYRVPEIDRVAITINETNIQLTHQGAINRISFKDILSLELERVIFFSGLKIAYNKKVNHKINHSLLMKMSRLSYFFWANNTKSRRHDSYSLLGLNVDKEEVVRSLNFHLEQFKAGA